MTNGEGKITYLMEGIKKHQIFLTDYKFWETCIMYKNLTMRSQPDDKAKHTIFLSGVVRNILSVAFYMNDVFKDKQVVRDICTKFLQAYKVPDSQASDLTNYLQSIMKSADKS